MTAQIATALGPALDEPGALQLPSTVHVSEGSLSVERRTTPRTTAIGASCPFPLARAEVGFSIAADVELHSI
ncbi:MAG TPA: hypothetical protein VF772_24080, partial [Terriglobales bacterium]